MSSPERLHALVVTYRRPDELAPTLDALAGQSRPPDTITVVDNDPDRSARDVVSTCVSAEYLPTGSNLGPAGGLAAGFDFIRKRAEPEDLVVFVDDDDPPPNSTILADLLDFRSNLPDSIGCVGAVGAAGACFDRRTGLLRRLHDAELAGAVRVQYIGGNQFPIYSVAALSDAGCSRPDLFFGFDDLELGLRLEAHGYAVLAAGEIWAQRRSELGRESMSSREAAGIRERSSWRRYYGTRNLIWIAREHGGVAAPWVASLRHGLLTAAADAARGRSLAVALPSLRGVRDAWRGTLGRTIEPA